MGDNYGSWKSRLAKSAVAGDHLDEQRLNLPDDPTERAALEFKLAALQELQATQAELTRRMYLIDPVSWVEERLGEFVWSKQAEIARAVVEHRTVAVPTCHTIGKSWLVARLAAWWIDAHPPGEAFVVTTASTWKQVQNVVWREIRRVHVKAGLRGYTNQTEWLAPIPGTEGTRSRSREQLEVIAFGHRPADNDFTAFQGIHAPHVLVIVDEATGIPKPLWAAMDSLTSNEGSRLIAVGNPDDPVSHFAEICKPDSGWHVIQISAFDTPNFVRCADTSAECGWAGDYRGKLDANNQPTFHCPVCDRALPPAEDVPDKVRQQLISASWVEEKRRLWGVTNPLYLAKVLGQFPPFNTDTLIPMSWLLSARELWDRVEPGTPTELGVDVGGGADKNVIALREGRRVRVIHENQEPDVDKTIYNIQAHLRTTSAACAKVEYVGIGKTAVDVGLNRGMNLVKVEVGNVATEEGFANLRAQAYWYLRQLFQAGDIAIDPDDDELLAQLADVRYEVIAGKVQIESKRTLKRRGKPSPDRADAVMLAMWPGDGNEVPKHVTWGRGAQSGMVIVTVPEETTA